MNEIEEIRSYIATIPTRVCPFAASSADAVIIREVKWLTFDSVEEQIHSIGFCHPRRWPTAESDPVLIVFANVNYPDYRDIDMLAEVLQNYHNNILEVFGSHPKHKLVYRRDLYPNIQVNTARALKAARLKIQNPKEP